MTYRKGAERFYDLFGSKEDASFYIELAQKHDDKALELGVGTARLAIQLARAGIDTWGIDNSKHMLKAAELNLEKEPKEVQNRLQLEFADVRDFDLGEEFGLIYFPSFSFDHILSRKEQYRVLRQIRKHLKPDGVYAFDLAYISEVKAEKDWFVEKKGLEGDREVVRIGCNKTDPCRRLMSVYIWYEIYEKGKMLERYFEGGEVYIHSLEGIKTMLRETGYKIEAVYGDYDKNRLKKNSDKMIIVTTPSGK
ncbi:MAG: class I SAM-dependent methyltransferase [Candidatus Bathyarchaeia archaeon]